MTNTNKYNERNNIFYFLQIMVCRGPVAEKRVARAHVKIMAPKRN